MGQKDVWAYLDLFWQHEDCGSSAFRFADRGAKLGLGKSRWTSRRKSRWRWFRDGGDDRATMRSMGAATREVEMRRTRTCIQSHKGVGRCRQWLANDPARHLNFESHHGINNIHSQPSREHWIWPAIITVILWASVVDLMSLPREHVKAKDEASSISRSTDHEHSSLWPQQPKTAKRI